MTTIKKTSKTTIKKAPASLASKLATKAITKKTTVTTGNAKAVATSLKADAVNKAEAIIKAPIALSDDKQALNAAFLAKLPLARPIFQRKFKPLNLAAHKPQFASERDYAFIHAIKTVYGDKPFTHKQSGADSGNLARAIALKLICEAGKNSDNETLYKYVSQKTA